ncbi:MAG: imidazolonepropionase [Terriglobia bacterium]
MSGPSTPRKGSVREELGIIDGGAVWIAGQVIKRVGTADQVNAEVGGKPVRHISAEHCVVLPGFVDSHTHPIFERPRDRDYEWRIRGSTYQEIAQMGGGILSSVRAVRESSPRQLFDLARRRLPRFLEHGTTTVECKSGYGLSLEEELKLLQVIRDLGNELPLELVPTFLGAHEIPEEFRHRKEDYVELVSKVMIPEVASRKLAQFCDCFVEEHVFPPSAAKKILEAARAHGMKIKLHADQLKRSGATLLGVEMEAVSIDHLEQIDASDIQALAHSHTLATLLPGSVFHLGSSQYPPARALLDAEVPVALATDFNPGTSPTLNMQMILSIACTQMRMTPAEAMVSATVNGAHALGMADRIGSIEAGKQADLCVMDVAHFSQIPYFFGMNHCVMTIKKGEIVYQRREG